MNLVTELFDQHTTVAYRIAHRLGPRADELRNFFLVEPTEFRRLQSHPSRITAEKLFREIDTLNWVRAFGFSREFQAELTVQGEQHQIDALSYELDKIDALRRLDIPADLFADIPRTVLTQFYAQTQNSSWAMMCAQPAMLRSALLASFALMQHTRLIDLVVHLLLQLIDHLHDRLTNLTHHQPRPRRGDLRGIYSPLHADILRNVLNRLEIRCHRRDYWPLMAAIGECLNYPAGEVGPRFFHAQAAVPLDGVLPPSWRDPEKGGAVVRDHHGNIERGPYELAVLFSFAQAIRHRGLALTHSLRWG